MWAALWRFIGGCVDRPLSLTWCRQTQRSIFAAGWHEGPNILWDVMKTQPWKTSAKPAGLYEQRHRQ